MNHRIRAFIYKEMLDYRRNRFIWLSALVLPIFIAIFILTVLFIPSDIPAEATELLADQFMVMFLIVPVVLPITVSAQSIVGERQQRSLEPVLSTPISNSELLWGKALAAGIPSLVGSYIVLAGFLVSGFFAAPPIVYDKFTSAGRLLAMVLLAPVLTALMVEVAMAVSARSTDARVAQQVSFFVALPGMVLLGLFTYGVLEITPFWWSVGAGGAAVLAVWGWLLLKRLFDRERILVRYG